MLTYAYNRRFHIRALMKFTILVKGNIGTIFKNLMFKKIDSFEGVSKIFINLKILLDGIRNSLPISATMLLSCITTWVIFVFGKAKTKKFF